jgi:hypothetical protein
MNLYYETLNVFLLKTNIVNNMAFNSLNYIQNLILFLHLDAYSTYNRFQCRKYEKKKTNEINVGKVYKWIGFSTYGVVNTIERQIWNFWN